MAGKKGFKQSLNKMVSDKPEVNKALFKLKKSLNEAQQLLEGKKKK